jgi:hypothetical protein
MEKSKHNEESHLYISEKMKTKTKQKKQISLNILKF